MKKILALIGIVFFITSCDSDSSIQTEEDMLSSTWKPIGSGGFWILGGIPLDVDNIDYSPFVDTNRRMIFNSDGEVYFYSNVTDLDTVFNYEIVEGFRFLSESEFHIIIGDEYQVWDVIHLSQDVLEIAGPADDGYVFTKYINVSN